MNDLALSFDSLTRAFKGEIKESESKGKAWDSYEKFKREDFCDDKCFQEYIAYILYNCFKEETELVLGGLDKE